MSETTLNAPSPAIAETKAKRSFSDLAFVKNFIEFKRAVYIGLSISTNKVTKFQSLSTAALIMTGVHVAWLILGVQIFNYEATVLIVPLQVFSFATQFYILSILFPVVHYVMKFYQHKRNVMLKAQHKQWKANKKALAKQQKEAEAAEKGTYVI